MAEPGIGGEKSDSIPQITPKAFGDPITNEIRTAAEMFNSPDQKERKLAAAAITRAAEYATIDPIAGSRLARLLRIRGVEEGLDDGIYSGLHRADENVRKSLERYESLVGGVHDVVMDVDKEGLISFINPAIVELAGYEPEELLDIRFDQLLFNDDTKKAKKAFQDTLDGKNNPSELRIVDSNGGIKWVRTTTTILKDKVEICGVTVRMNDITELKELQNQLRNESEHDALTGLFNRRRADDELEMLRKEGRRKRKYPVSILYIDVDEFKAINDSQGHEAGDEALQTIAKLISCGKSRPEDFIARYGGDEFIFIMQQASNEVAQKVIERVNNAFLGYNIQQNNYLSVSIGVATAADSRSINETLREADLAMYEVKDAKRAKKENGGIFPQLEE